MHLKSLSPFTGHCSIEIIIIHWLLYQIATNIIELVIIWNKLKHFAAIDCITVTEHVYLFIHSLIFHMYAVYAPIQFIVNFHSSFTYIHMYFTHMLTVY